MSGSETKQCPFCAEDVKLDAKICRFCRMDFTTAKPVGAVDNPVAPQKEIQARSGVADGVKLGCGMFIVLPLLIILGLIALGAFFSGVGSVNKPSSSSSSTVATPEEIRARDALTELHNKGWNWAQDKNATSSADCAQLSDAEERVGCVAFVTSHSK